MRLLLVSAALFTVGCSVQQPAATTMPLPELAGRIAGPPQKCIRFEQNESLRIAGPSELIYGSGRTIYLNVAPGCSGYRSSDILVLEPIGSNYCRGDFVRTRDSVSGIPGAGCRLGDFIPYTRG